MPAKRYPLLAVAGEDSPVLAHMVVDRVADMREAPMEHEGRGVPESVVRAAGCGMCVEVPKDGQRPFVRNVEAAGGRAIAPVGAPRLDAEVVISSILYFQRKMTGAALTSSIYRKLRKKLLNDQPICDKVSTLQKAEIFQCIITLDF